MMYTTQGQFPTALGRIRKTLKYFIIIINIDAHTHAHTTYAHTHTCMHAHVHARTHARTHTRTHKPHTVIRSSS